MDNLKIQCACGCGTWFNKYVFGRGFPSDKRERKYLNGHNRKNVKYSEEDRQQMSKSRKGKCYRFNYKHSEETRQKISKSNMGKVMPKGEKCAAWKGGVTLKDRLERMKFREILQKKVFERDNYTCQICGVNGDLQVDHIKPWVDYPELRFSIDNCRTLCAKCHYELTFGRPMPENLRGWGHNLFKEGVLT